MLELQLDCHVRCCHLDNSRLEARKEVVHGRLVLGHYLWSCSGHTRIRILHCLGFGHPWRGYWRCLQLRNQEYVPLLFLCERERERERERNVSSLSIVKYWIKIDDTMDVFAEHGVAGILGLLANALFGATYIIGLDGVNTGVISGGWIDHNYKQLYIQVAYIVAACGWAFTVSLIIAYGINFIPGLHLRATEEAELLGMDDDQLGEFAYDYVEVRRDYLAWTPAKAQPTGEANVPQHERHGVTSHADMLIGKDPSDTSSGEAHTGIGGDRHGIVVEKLEKEKHGQT